jgi:predicted ATPase
MALGRIDSDNMRIAISGSHRVGKTSLAEALAANLPGYELVPEPYHALEDEGHEFGEMPSLDDFILQLERSLESIEQSGADAIFDRCPLDILAYLLTHDERGAFDVSVWADRIRDAMSLLALVVVVSVERPDRISVPREEQRLRAEVDDALQDLVLDSRYAGDVEILHVAGTVEHRMAQVLGRLRGMTASTVSRGR